MAMCAASDRIPFWGLNAVSLAYLMASAVFVPPLVYLEEININGFEQDNNVSKIPYHHLLTFIYNLRRH